MFAIQASTLACLSLADCHAILREDGARWRWIALLSATTSELAIGLAGDLLLRDPQKRVIATLLRLAGLRGSALVPAMSAPINLSQEKLGQLVNLSRTVVSGILRDLEKQGYIEIQYRGILVSNQAALSSLLQETASIPT